MGSMAFIQFSRSGQTKVAREQGLFLRTAGSVGDVVTLFRLAIFHDIKGTSFNYVVSQKQDDLANAQLAELAALLAHEKASAALARATGLLLDQRHIELQ